MRNEKIAIRYARALLDLSIELSVTDQIIHDMALVNQTCRENRELKVILDSPVVNSQLKTGIFETIFKDKIHDISQRFLGIIIRKNREAMLQDISEEFEKLFKIHKGIRTVIIRTALPLAPETLAKVRKMAEAIAKSPTELVEEVSDDLIGGFVLTMEDSQIDASIKQKIREITDDFHINEYIKKL
ncbi:MAG: ATP synthase F1 subunit delta [Bacteroidetes bacterium]|nr:ATP synthase F1 subunit delta [Bacteroidota bacterium]MBU1717956.1 ATP synthase F1 subunit delta [Bacteroidota bacterium]